MDEALIRRALVARYKAYLEILSERGLSYLDLSETDLETASLDDLRRLVRDVEAVARTPVR